MIALTPGSRTFTVLVVDDDAAVRLLIARELEQGGFRVLTAANGVEALAVLNEADIEVDLIVCDLLMPQLDGYHLAECVAALSHPAKIIFTSAFRSDPELDRPVLAKPFHLDDLTDAVRSILQEPASGS